MKISFHGAAREVTGSCHLVEANGLRVLLDCGLIQGGSDRHERNRQEFPFDLSKLDFVLLSHAHIDHSGRLPRLVRAGYEGPILCSAPTRALAKILLPDAGRIQEEDARWKVKRLRKKGKDYSWVKPLFSEEDAWETLKRFESVPFGQWFPLDGKAQARFVEAGHILGASIVEVRFESGEGSRRLAFSGDLGVPDARLLGFPKPVPCPEVLIIESTYGDRLRDPCCDATEELYEVISKTIDRGGKVIIPAFAVGRTQEVLARINDLVEQGRLGGFPIYVDSPMAVQATRVVAVHPQAYSEKARKLYAEGDKPLEFPGLHLTRDVDESIALNKSKQPSVIISASGMCDAGRIKHHLKHNISSSRNTILFVGYQAHGSLGRVIESGADPVRIFGEYLPVRAKVTSIDSFSAHADQKGLLCWYRSLEGNPKQTYVVHGEEQSAVTFAGTLKAEFEAAAYAPRRGETVEV